MKPRLLKWSAPFRSIDYIDPSWMSSTYAVRKTDEYEKAFMQELDKDTKLEYRRKSGSLGANASLLLLQ